MTKQSRRKFSAEFKAKVALEAIKNEKTMAELGHQFEVNPVTISKWKNEFLERMSVVFENGTSKKSIHESFGSEEVRSRSRPSTGQRSLHASRAKLL